MISVLEDICAAEMGIVDLHLHIALNIEFLTEAFIECQAIKDCLHEVINSITFKVSQGVFQVALLFSLSTI